MSSTVERLRESTRGTDYENRLFLVGGVVRDQVLGLQESDDVDIVLEGDAGALARFLHERGISDHFPVTYPRFGTAMIAIDGHNVELVGARAESYDPGSRKPSVKRATLKDDVYRRDFTINTLLQNLHTGEILDLTGRAMDDLRAGIIRTPLEPLDTFYDDPLRMMRAIRFAVRFGFEIESTAWEAIKRESRRLNLMGPEAPVVSAERIRDEFVKMLMTTCREGTRTRTRPRTKTIGPAPTALGLLRESGLLAQFFPELLEMVGVTQNSWHVHDVWTHTMVAMDNLQDDASLELRLGLLLHDVGKPRTRSEDEKGVHFYEHQFVGAEMARVALHRLKFTNDQIHHVFELVRLHMRLGECRPEWSDAAVRRLIRDTSAKMDELFELSRCDMAAIDPDAPATDLVALRQRIDALNAQMNAATIISPLDGVEIMELLGIPAGPAIREAKDMLVNEVIEGRLGESDKEAAEAILRRWWAARES